MEGVSSEDYIRFSSPPNLHVCFRDVQRFKSFKPPVPREEYIMRSVESSWPKGEWLSGSGVLASGGSLDLEQSTKPPQAQTTNGHVPTLTIIGGTKYDEDAFDSYMDSLTPGSHVILGAGKGAESRGKEFWIGPKTQLSPDPDRFGKHARKVNVEQVLSFAPQSPVLLVGEGERVKQAKAWLKRANWGREVIELP